MKDAGRQRFAGSELLALFGEALNPGEPIPAKELWERNYDIPGNWMLDPVQLASEAQDPRYAAIAREIQQREAAVSERRIDSGAVAIDELFRRIAGRTVTNLSGQTRPEEVVYPLEEGVSYRRGPLRSLVSGGKGAITEYVSFADTPMLDWDLPDPSHVMASITVRHLGDVEELARQYVRDSPESLLRLYQTPGGYRAWDLGVRSAPTEARGRLEKALVDPLYLSFSEARPDVVHASGLRVDGPGFSSRISGKPGRTDWVAQPILELKGSHAQPDPISMRRVERFHDRPISLHYLGHGVSPDAVALLQQQLPSASQSLQQEARRRLGL